MIITAEPQSNGRCGPNLFTSHIWPGASVLLIWSKHGIRTCYGKKANWQKQCDALGDVLLGDLGLCHLWKYPLTCTTVLSIVGDHVLILWKKLWFQFKRYKINDIFKILIVFSIDISLWHRVLHKCVANKQILNLSLSPEHIFADSNCAPLQEVKHQPFTSREEEKLQSSLVKRQKQKCSLGVFFLWGRRTGKG